MDHALVGGLGHPAGAQHQTVHVGIGVCRRVLLEGLQLHHDALLLALPIGLQVQGLYRHHSLHPGGGGNGGNVHDRMSKQCVNYDDIPDNCGNCGNLIRSRNQ